MRTYAGRHGLLVLVLLLFASPGLRADKMPPLWGYGVKTCSAFLAAAEAQGAQAEGPGAEYRRYEDWLSGFVSGLNLATGKDVLVGADIGSAMGRIRAWCGGHKKEDFFTGTMDLVRMLSGLK